MRLLRTISLTAALPLCVAIATSTPAIAQIQVGQLADASAFDASVLQDGETSLDSALWQDTNALAARSLIENADLSATGMARDLIRAAILSAGVPPRADDGIEREFYLAAKLNALLEMGDVNGFDTLARGAGLRNSNPGFSTVFARRALLGGDVEGACQQSDAITAQRAEPFWAKLRAFCHVTRGEIPAAELTADILRRSGEKDADFFGLLGALTGSVIKLPKLPVEDTAINTAMLQAFLKSKAVSLSDIENLPTEIAKDIAADPNAPADIRLAALLRLGPNLSAETLGPILTAAAPVQDGTLLAAPPELDASWTLEDWASAYSALQFGGDADLQAGIAAAMLKNAEIAGVQRAVSGLIAPNIRSLPAETLVNADAALFARLAAARRDLGALRGLYDALPPEHALRGRIALASDAIGGAFMLADLGTDIETRLQGEGDAKNRAVRDAYLAAALGGRLSGGAADNLSDLTISKGEPAGGGAELAIRSAARRGAKAETALRAAYVLAETPADALRIDSLAAIVFAFMDAGMSEQAGLLAAQDFLAGDFSPPE